MKRTTENPDGKLAVGVIFLYAVFGRPSAGKIDHQNGDIRGVYAGNAPCLPQI